jgi:hypothetical protein
MPIVVDRKTGQVVSGQLTPQEREQAWERIFEIWIQNRDNQERFFRRVDEIEQELMRGVSNAAG